MFPLQPSSFVPLAVLAPGGSLQVIDIEFDAARIPGSAACNSDFADLEDIGHRTVIGANPT